MKSEVKYAVLTLIHGIEREAYAAGFEAAKAGKHKSDSMSKYLSDADNQRDVAWRNDDERQ